MKNEQLNRTKRETMIIKKCHVCGTIHESFEEVQKCTSCKKSFLPTNYFNKVHAKSSEDYKKLYCTAEELFEDDFILGLTVLW